MPALLSRLPESGPSRGRRSPAGVAVSVVLHAALIAGAVAATVSDGPAAPGPAVVDTNLIWFPDPPPPPVAHGGRGATGRPSGPVATTPTPIPGPEVPPLPGLAWQPDSMPTHVIDDVGDVAGRGRSGGDAASGGAPGSPGGGPYTFAQVDVPAAMRPGGASPRYPTVLRERGVEGRVVVQFVVDTAGRVEPGTVRVVSSPDDLFTAAVRAALPSLRFTPARAGGRAVRQLVELPFEFAMGK